MDAIKSWAMTVCFAALAAGMAGMIAPKGNLEKVYKFAISLFFLCCVLVPLFKIKNINLDFKISSSSTQQTSGIEKTISDQTISQAQINIASLVKETCIKKGTTPLSVNAIISINSERLIAVERVDVILKKTDVGKKSDLTSAVKNELGIEITIKEGEN